MINVFVNGCFDIVHIGHIDLLNYAKQFGDNLYVGIDSDLRIKKNKGENRPFNDENDRKRFLENIKCVNNVFIFNSDEELENLIKKLKIDFMIVGEEYKYKKVIGSQYSKNLFFFKKEKEISSTKIIQNEQFSRNSISTN